MWDVLPNTILVYVVYHDAKYMYYETQDQYETQQ